ncbi:hypothetical protein CEXT_551201 [Caerostris extrusa]|uniref:Uncharacterized protein n=1 Tax=Caerostris extrusa TaxID=172846 RepID=A0AAV4XUQ6_CAEEX|nr:hypothetical protein CEXT_551201 [Caerostris extrusa]
MGMLTILMNARPGEGNENGNAENSPKTIKKKKKRGTNSVEIRRLSVPRWIQNGTEDAVVLDCEYVYTENDFRLVVKWFFRGQSRASLSMDSCT